MSKKDKRKPVDKELELYRKGFNMDEIHKDMMHHFKGKKYFVIASDEANEKHPAIYSFGNMSPEMLLSVLEGFVEAISSGNAVETHIKESDMRTKEDLSEEDKNSLRGKLVRMMGKGGDA